MPLSIDGTHACLICGNERKLKKSDWILDPDDETVFTSPPCACGAQETFCSHDDIQFKPMVEQVPLAPETPGGPPRVATIRWIEPDHANFHARHMVAIDKVASVLNRKRKAVNPHPPEIKYSEAPTGHSLDDLRDHISKVRERRAKRHPATANGPRQAKEHRARLIADAEAGSARRGKEIEIEKQESERRKAAADAGKPAEIGGGRLPDRDPSD